ncbi:hypothetical protein BDE02_15G103300 [Populus trichocarpa]|nr:hypothetical protein BDE02_15G103300 [Populus trichocarpa]
MSHHNTYQSQEAYPPPSQQAPPQYSDPPPSQQAHPPQGYHQGPYVAPPAAEKKRHKCWRCCVYSCCKRLYCWRCCLDCCCECSPVFVLMSVIHHYSNHISGNPCGKLT